MALPPVYTRHALTPARRFDDLRIGERYPLPSRTLTDGHFSAFQMLSLDNHPIHYDKEYCEALGHPGVLAHGLQILCFTAAGAGLFPHEIGSSLLGLIEIQARLLKGAYVGDTLYPCLEITDLKLQRTTGLATLSATIVNQRDELVLDGRHVYLLRL